MPSRKNVIFIDDDPSVRTAREQTLKLAGYETLCLESSQEALRHISPNWNGVLVTDVKMPGMDGMELIRHVLAIDPELPVVLITGHGDVPMAVDAMHLGAFDFLEKPCPTETFLQIVQNALEKRRLVLEKRALQKRRPGASEVRNQIIGKSPAVERLRKIIDNAADSDADVLITGETGTGKELVAACLHYQGKRRDGVFVAVNCGAIPETLIENELFGHEAGAFTGAQARRLGKFEFANNGTLFLDEIESMPLPLQVKLLRVLQERMVERLGSNKAIPINIRVVAATKINLEEACDQGLFRRDLYYRLNVVRISLPPLRERLEDVPLLFRYFVSQACAAYQFDEPEYTSEFFQELMARDWPGNIRELKNEAERYVLNAKLGIQEPVSTSDSESPGGPSSPLTLPHQVDTFEKILIEQELARQKGDIKKTYTALGLPRQTLYDKMKKYSLKRSDFLSRPSRKSLASTHSDKD